MKTKNIEPDDLARVHEAKKMALILSKLRNIELFAEKIRDAKKQLERINKNMANRNLQL